MNEMHNTEIQSNENELENNKDLDNEKLESANLNNKPKPEIKNDVYTTPQKRKTDDQVVEEIIINWANAWQNKNLDEYFSFYSDEFTSNYFDNHEVWKKDRTKRIESKSDIKIKVNDFSVTFEIEKNEIAIAKFKQNYVSNTYNDTVIKKITLIKSRNEWKIISEDLIDGKY